MENKITNTHIATFRDMGTLYLRYSGTEKTKLHFAVEKMVKKLKSLHEDYIDKQNDLRNDHAAIDTDKKILLRDAVGQFQYTQENEKKLRKALRELGNVVVSIEPHFVPAEAMPEKLSFTYTGNDSKSYEMTQYDVKLAFEGFVIPYDQES